MVVRRIFKHVAALRGLFTLGLLFAGAVFLVAGTFSAQPALAASADWEEGRISVSGVGLVEVAPDQASVSFSARGRARSAAEAMALQARRSALANEVLQSFGIAEHDIQTTHLTLREEWTHRNNERVLIGYIAEQYIQAATDQLDRLGELIDALVEKADIESIQNIQFMRKDRQDAADQALREAYRHAESRARIIADTAGAGALRPIRIVDQSRDTAPIPMQAELARAVSFDAVGTTIQPGLLTVEARVQVEFAFEPGPDADLMTEYNRYKVGEPVVLQLHNRGSTNLGYNLCTSNLERRIDGQWRPQVTHRICTMELRNLAPGAFAAFTFDDTGSWNPGVYRFQTRIETSDGDWLSIVTDPFSIEGADK